MAVGLLMNPSRILCNCNLLTGYKQLHKVCERPESHLCHGDRHKLTIVCWSFYLRMSKAHRLQDSLIDFAWGLFGSDYFFRVASTLIFNFSDVSDATASNHEMPYFSIFLGVTALVP